MPAAMEGWRSSGASSKEEQESGGTTGSGAGTGGKGSELAALPLVAAGSKRQRRPSVRLGEIGDLKVAASKSESLSSVRWTSPNLIPKKSSSGVARGGKLPRTRPLANVTHRGEIGQVLGSPKVGTNEVVVVPPAPFAATEVNAEDDVEKDEEDADAEEAGPPSTSGRGNYANPTASPRYGTNRRGKPGKRKRAASIRSSSIAKTIGVVALNRKAKELQKVGYIGNLAPAAAPAASTADVSEQLPIEFAELSGTQADMEEDSGAGRGGPGSNNNNEEENSEEEEHTQNGDTEVLEGDNGNGEDSSGRHEEDEPGTSLGVRDNQNMNTNGTKGAPHDFPLPNKGDHRDHCTSRLTDGEKDRKNTLLVREASMNGRRGDARVRDWLGSLGLDKYSDLFEENEVDNDVLHLLTFEDLKEMGVVAVGARRKMFAAIQALGTATLVVR